MAVKWGKAFGCEVTVISTSASKKSEAVDRLGADKFVVSPPLLCCCSCLQTKNKTK